MYYRISGRLGQATTPVTAIVDTADAQDAGRQAARLGMQAVAVAPTSLVMAAAGKRSATSLPRPIVLLLTIVLLVSVLSSLLGIGLMIFAGLRVARANLQAQALIATHHAQQQQMYAELEQNTHDTLRAAHDAMQRLEHTRRQAPAPDAAAPMTPPRPDDE